MICTGEWGELRDSGTEGTNQLETQKERETYGGLGIDGMSKTM
jgi:hypothetical protein